ncbi:MAG: hypothetical protein K5858_04355 [Lachnospiraceae bacterium]|nr:hypothetical protein [Lachnospiraceae bacterium]
MKYGESSFDIIYLIFAIVTGLIILAKRKDSLGRLMGCAALILGCGDAFHLVPRVLNYFVDADFTFWLGFGKLVTSITMTVFYVLMYRIWLSAYKEPAHKTFSICFYAFAICRIALCLMPGNNWFTNDSPLLWGILRNIPFIVVGCMIVIIYFKKRSEIKEFKLIWLFVTLSFAFYIPVTVGASFIPILGALMLPKTVCYMLLLVSFYNKAKE